MIIFFVAVVTILNFPVHLCLSLWSLYAKHIFIIKIIFQGTQFYRLAVLSVCQHTFPLFLDDRTSCRKLISKPSILSSLFFHLAPFKISLSLMSMVPCSVYRYELLFSWRFQFDVLIAVSSNLSFICDILKRSHHQLFKQNFFCLL